MDCPVAHSRTQSCLPSPRVWVICASGVSAANRRSMSARAHRSISWKCPQTLCFRWCCVGSAVWTLLAEHLRRKRHQRAGRRWYVDETSIAVKGQWAYLYRAIDSDGQLVDSLLSEHRDLAAAKAFFESARSVVGRKPQQVTTDGHTRYTRAIQETLGKRVAHRIISYLGNPIEQDHRGIKQRCYPMLGFKAVVTAAGFCRVSEEVRSYFRPRQKVGEAVTLGKGRELFMGRYLKLQDQFCVAV